MVLPLSRLHGLRGERKALMAARPFVPERGNQERDCCTYSGKGLQYKMLLMKDVKGVATGYINTQEKGLCNCFNLTIFGH